MSGRRSGFVFQKIGRALLPWTALSNRGQDVRPDRIFEKQNRARRARTSIPETSFFNNPHPAFGHSLEASRDFASPEINIESLISRQMVGRGKIEWQFITRLTFGHSLEASRDFASPEINIESLISR